jgi:uncharacterized ferredoxin-like protein
MLSEEKIKKETLMAIAKKMVIAARTAPKGKGADTFVFCIAEEADIKKLSEKMKEMGKKYDAGAFLRDSESILSSPVMVLLGTRIKPVGLRKCGMCGFKNCEEKDKEKNIPCVFNTGDLGIALGSAVSLAADHRVDNRIIYTAGQAALEMGLLGEGVRVAYAIPLSATSKNPFFDRK